MVTVVGMGPGGAEYITPAAKQAIADADLVIGSLKWRAAVAELGRELMDYAPLKRMIDLIRSREKDENIAVVVSGDPALFSLYGVIKRKLPEIDCRVISGVSAPQALLAKLGVDWESVPVVSLHGRRSLDGGRDTQGYSVFLGCPGDNQSVPDRDGDDQRGHLGIFSWHKVSPSLQYQSVPDFSLARPPVRSTGHRVCVLTDRINTPAAICADLKAQGIGGAAVVGANLTMDDERIFKTTIDELADGRAVAELEASTLVTLYLEIENAE